MYKSLKILFIFYLLLCVENVSLHSRSRTVVKSCREFTKENCTYFIKKEIDLCGELLIIPSNCKLVFKGKGNISNGAIQFDHTVIKNPKFQNVNCSGQVVTQDIHDSDFDFQDDCSQLIWLIEMSALNNTTLSLSHDYHISSRNYVQRKDIDGAKLVYLVLLDCIDGFSIKGNNYTIYDDFVTHSEIVDFIVLNRCKNINISNLNYCQPYNRPCVDLEIGGGVEVIRTIGDCSDINLIGVSGENVCAVFRAGIWGLNNYVTTGLSNSVLDINALNVRYGIAIDRADNVELNISFKDVHRGISACGLTNSTINSFGCNAKTPTLVLLKDSISYSKADINYTTPIFTECNNVVVNSTRNGLDDNYDVAVYIADYGKEYHFTNRNTPYRFENIIVNIRNMHGTKSQGVVVALHGKNDVKDYIDIKITSPSFNNKGYHFFNMNSSDNIYGSITFDEIQTNGKISMTGESELNVLIQNSLLGDIAYDGDATSGYVRIHKSKFGKLIPLSNKARHKKIFICE